MKSPEQLILEEEFAVIIKMESQPNRLLLTYSKKVGGRLTQIDEINAAEETITSCKFKGRASTGDCPQDIKDLKPLLGSVKTKEWPLNVDMYVDGFYKIH